VSDVSYNSKICFDQPVARRTDGRWGRKVLERRPRTGKRSVVRPPTRWTDDLMKVAGSRWMRAAKDHRGEPCGKPMSSSASLSAEMMMLNRFGSDKINVHSSLSIFSPKIFSISFIRQVYFCIVLYGPHTSRYTVVVQC
jgi:hypothetical protein